jgi:hypothetical protein
MCDDDAIIKDVACRYFGYRDIVVKALRGVDTIAPLAKLT